MTLRHDAKRPGRQVATTRAATAPRPARRARGNRRLRARRPVCERRGVRRRRRLQVQTQRAVPRRPHPKRTRARRKRPKQTRAKQAQARQKGVKQKGPKQEAPKQKEPLLGPTAPAPRQRPVRGGSAAARGPNPGPNSLPSCTRPASSQRDKPSGHPGRRRKFLFAVHTATPTSAISNPGSAGSPAQG